MKSNNELIEVVKATELAPSEAQVMLDNFTDLFEQAKQWELKAQTIVVSEETQVAEMEQAKEARSALKRIRLDAEAKRKELKEKSLREGKAIDGIANVIKALIVPIEEYLEKQEKFLEIRKEERLQVMVTNRRVLLANYIENPDFYNLKEMSEEGFNTLVENSKVAFVAKKKAERDIEEARIKKEEDNRIEQEKIRQERDKLLKEAAAQEKIRVAEREKEAVEREKIVAQQKKDSEARQAAEKELLEKKQAEENVLKAESDRIAKEIADKEKLAKETRYQEFLVKHKYTSDTKHLFKVEKVGNQVLLYKLTGTFNID